MAGSGRLAPGGPSGSRTCSLKALRGPPTHDSPDALTRRNSVGAGKIATRTSFGTEGSRVRARPLRRGNSHGGSAARERAPARPAFNSCSR